LATANELQDILLNCSNAKYRFGFTGTLPGNKVNLYSLKSFLGPVVKEYPYSYLAERGYVAKCNINIINLEYLTDDKFFGKYKDVRDAVFQDIFTMDVIRNLVEEINGNILMLVTFKRKEGDFLRDELKRMFPKKEVVFLSGDDGLDIREDAKTRFARNEGNMIFIATYGIFQLGINIPTLKYLFLAAPAKSEIRVLQSIGRGLRIHASKVGGAEIYDMVHQVKSLIDQADMRRQYYDQEGFNIRERTYKQEHGGNIYF
jgi:superfamily II DNA or RNA helicase